MKIAVYALRGQDVWELWLTLDPRVDLVWWAMGRGNWSVGRGESGECKVSEGEYGYGVSGEQTEVECVLLLSSDLPLGFAVMMRDDFKHRKEMDRWTPDDWTDYVRLKWDKDWEVQSGNAVSGRENQMDHRSMRSRDGSSIGDQNRIGGRRTVLTLRPACIWERKKGITQYGVDICTVYADLEDGMNSRVNGGYARLRGIVDWLEAVQKGPGTVDKVDQAERISGEQLSAGMQKKGMQAVTLETGRKGGEQVAKLMEIDGGRPSPITGSTMAIPPDWRTALAVAEQLASALAGRSLLLPELQQLLGERLPQLAAEWRTAAQLAHVQRRLTLMAGLAPAVSPAGRLRFSRRPRAPRCRRCGSEALRRTPCAACGSLGCAYCEACLALGRSRACALLLRGAALPVVPLLGSTAEGSPTGALLDRWGLSPAQREAAGAALRFLAQPPTGGARSSPAGSISRISMNGPGFAEPRSSNTRSGMINSNSANVNSIGSTPESSYELNHLITISSNFIYRVKSIVGGLIRPQSLVEPPRFLLWAVTGAGKTEMIFPLLRYILDGGGRALVATPRRDVVLELAPRLAKAFPDEPAAVLYGGSSERWNESRLVLATTHQLMRFHEAFDLVIIDELDAFPYHNDPMLAYAAAASCKPQGKFIFLSATPPKKLQREVSRGQLEHAKVPSRFHGHPLPVPHRINMKSVASCLESKHLPTGLCGRLHHSIHRGAQIFVFVSRIKHIGPLVTLLRRQFTSIAIEGTSSQDASRGDKVIAFRNGDIRMLITTTILERGVTVPRSDVFILDADSGLFDEASLVQMAGRAGRSKDDPNGIVVLASPQWTISQRGAVRQIKSMNAIAKRSGYLIQ